MGPRTSPAAHAGRVNPPGCGGRAPLRTPFQLDAPGGPQWAEEGDSGRGAPRPRALGTRETGPALEIRWLHFPGAGGTGGVSGLPEASLQAQALAPTSAQVREATPRLWGRAGHLQRAGLPVGRSGRGDALAGAALGGSPGRPAPRGLSPPRAQGVSVCCSALRFSHQPGTELQARRREGLGAGMPSACRGQALRVCLACRGLSGVPPRCRAPRLSNRATPSVLRN